MKIQAKKSLGQHFLNSRHVLEQIISAARLREGENVLEIGPGTGVLTEALLKSGAIVTAVEKDDRSIAVLTGKFATEISGGRLNLINGDVLELLNDLLFKTFANRGNLNSDLEADFSIVANIPYYITGAILEKFLEYAPRPSRMVLLVQKEVAKRILGRLPGGEGKESVLSIAVKAFGSPKIVATVPPGAFTPPPSVDSAILSIENISADRFHQSEDNRFEIMRFFEIVKAGFAHKRKFLLRNLEAVVPAQELKSIWTDQNLDEKARAEDLDIEQWLKIASALTSPVVLN